MKYGKVIVESADGIDTFEVIATPLIQMQRPRRRCQELSIIVDEVKVGGIGVSGDTGNLVLEDMAGFEIDTEACGGVTCRISRDEGQTPIPGAVKP